MSYSVKEIFYTLQGVGANAGRPAVFCRFAGCNLWSGREEDRATAVCQFCDTDFVGIDGVGGGAKVMMRPAAPGTGVIAGGAVRTVLELAGIRNILAKQLGSNNPLNNARAAVNALSTLRTLSEVAEDRGIAIEKLYI
jgi:hypothetical protein